MIKKISELVKAVCDKEKDLDDVEFLTDFIYTKLNSFTNYFECVYNDVVHAEMDHKLLVSGHIDRETYMFRREQTDSRRRTAHESAIAACSALNRLCGVYGVDAICPTTDDRHVIAEFIGEFTNSVFQSGIKYNHQYKLDNAVEVEKELCKDINYSKKTFKELVKDELEL